MKEVYGEQRRKKKTTMAINNAGTDNGLVILTYLQNIDTLPRDVAVDLILVVEVSSIHLGGLIHGMFNLHRDATASL